MVCKTCIKLAMMSLANRSHLRPGISLKASQSQATSLACPCPSHQMHLPEIHWSTAPHIQSNTPHVTLCNVDVQKAPSTEAPSLALFMSCLMPLLLPFSTPYELQHTQYGFFLGLYFLLLPPDICCQRSLFGESESCTLTFCGFPFW